LVLKPEAEVVLNRRTKVELYEEIRREYEHGAGSIKGVAQKLGVHRRMVREALASAVPRERKVPARERPKLAAAVPFIEAVLEGPESAAEAAAYGAPDLETTGPGAAGSGRWGIDSA